ncbi:hypothetical protein GCM10011390_08370 [Aureimonas endophytica]|uniref:SpoVT-AbrB domain-containing protein n=1 Tax=Aureimonas endophytica TaxID=2027858 RepID=A0A916ZF56_9HYPH|nr:AbrB/MazE/SpoVT family DNA-binding domain-containing protein [Aureimonas endophytica]GGD91945.1 hypothetical protein GCM10011390_08370 [Aureimonas endophytica]
MTMTAKISEVGSVLIPRSVREANGWAAGTELEIVAHRGEVLLRPKASRRRERYPPITIDEFVARVPRYEGPAVTDDMIQAAILDEAKRRWHAKGD